MSITDQTTDESVTDPTMETVSAFTCLDMPNEILNEIVENESKEIKDKSADERNKSKHKKSTRMSERRRKKYSCYQCDKSFTFLGVLQRHIKIVHEGIRFPCKLCGQQSTTQSDLKRHIKAKHSDDETLILN